jgi:hypothetical protein
MKQKAIALSVAFGCALIVATGVSVGAQRGQGRGGPPPTPRAAAPVDLTGYWVSVVTEDWRFRMVTPPKGDYASVPLNAEARRVADSWDPSKDGACDAYGAAAIMRMPGRLHITWDGDNTLKIETDAGQQTRLLHFGPSTASGPSRAESRDGASRPASGERTLQGYSAAEWGRGGGPAMWRLPTLRRLAAPGRRQRRPPTVGAHRPLPDVEPPQPRRPRQQRVAARHRAGRR